MRTRSMTGGPWTRSMIVVHGPGPRWESMNPWSMFCPHPLYKYRPPASLTTQIQPPPQALRFSHGRGAKQVTGDEPQGTMGRVETAGELCLSNRQFAIRAISVFACNLTWNSLWKAFQDVRTALLINFSNYAR